MSIWSDIHKRSNGTTIRKEDVDANIAKALSEVKFKYNLYNDKILLEVKSEDKSGWIYTDYVPCRIATLLNLQTYGLCITLNTNENVKAIKDVKATEKSRIYYQHILHNEYLG